MKDGNAPGSPETISHRKSKQENNIYNGKLTAVKAANFSM